jgi:hypothetical protein
MRARPFLLSGLTRPTFVSIDSRVAEGDESAEPGHVRIDSADV